MGQRLTGIFHRNEENVQEVAIANSSAYRWPPKTGNYFGSHFIMGGERFDSQQPEAFLFGENSDLNFLGSRPMPFPYPAPQLNEPTRTLRSLVNIRKDTIRLVKCEAAESSGSAADVGAGGDGAAADKTKDSPSSPRTSAAEEVDVEAGDAETPVDDSRYNIEFTFDSDVTCNIAIIYFAQEDVVNGVAVYTPRDESINSEPFTYKKGASQVFSQSSHIIHPSTFTDEDWSYSVDKEEIPIVIHCTVDKEADHTGQSHITFCVLERLNDGYHIKAIKQKQCVDGLLYILQEFYGIENKENDHAKDDDDEFADNTAECVICMSDIRDTLILPCRHLCLCNGCADSLRYQANNCPICRAPFRALLQLRAVRRKGTKTEVDTATNGSDDDDDLAVSQKGVPTGFEAISLIEALNGPCFHGNKNPDQKQQRVLSSRGSIRRSKKSKKKSSKHTIKDKNHTDKDDIVDEEKAREAELNSELRDNEVNETQANDSNTEANGKSADDSEEKEGEEEDKKEESQKATGEQETCADKEGDEKSSDQVMKEKVNGANVQESDEVEPSAQEADRCSIASDRISECPAGADDDGYSNEESDTLTMSAVSQATTLPGTPDHVIEDDELTAASAEFSV